jgi:hypothetical protein
MFDNSLMRKRGKDREREKNREEGLLCLCDLFLYAQRGFYRGKKFE